ncbi:cysteine peptidase family C39 domain-containing protein [Roseiconus lacunae]|uniref:Cysteine peptidase family C39 domain-containing protein n=1 Tax=Roseiconus lacunae TaxID=2605694 RepID=A0ABT7PND7_9BACT|nr:cysteine peptidase family C39 domain-containing protein [Roseiconus lacunae]MDM4017801.1 cysteine peptidase family C39 domain-containing protein [Roseiconus lacunae]
MDLWIAIAFVSAVSSLAFVAGWKLSLSVYHGRPLLLVECLLFLLIFAFGLANRLFWASAFSTPAAMGWSNWLPIFLSFTAGLATNACSLRRSWRAGTSLAMLFLAIGFLVQPVVRPNLYPITLASQTTWQNNVCLQSSESSCGPAAAATLLRHHSLLPWAKNRLGWSEASSEAMMADACLTSGHGTSSLGLVRGLRLATEGSQFSVAVADDDPRHWQTRNQLPNLAVICFRGSGHGDTVRRLLGTDGDAHAVMVHGRTPDGLWKVADPAVGWRYFQDDEFRRVFTGEAIYLARH